MRSAWESSESTRGRECNIAVMTLVIYHYIICKLPKVPEILNKIDIVLCIYILLVSFYV